MPESRFEVVLKHRKLIEEKVQRELAEIKELLKGEEEKLVYHNRLQKDSLKDLHQKKAKGVTASEILLYSSFFERLSMRIKGQERIIERIKAGFNNKLKELVKASRSKEVAKRLKEKEMEELYIEELRKEQKFVDEIGVGGYNRNRARKDKEGYRV